MKKCGYIFLMLLAACSESTVEPDLGRVGFDYFPLEVGRYAVYQVESIDYNVLGAVDTNRYKLKTSVADSFVNQEGTITYVIHRETRAGASDVWEFQSAWSAYLNDRQAVSVEENVPYLKLSFPVDNGKEWDGNRLNTFEEDIYEMGSPDGSYIAPNNDSIANVLTIIQSDNEDFIIQQDKRIEMYAQGIGLVYKETLLINYCADPDCIGLQEIESGSLYTQELISYGKD